MKFTLVLLLVLTVLSCARANGNGNGGNNNNNDDDDDDRRYSSSCSAAAHQFAVQSQRSFFTAKLDLYLRGKISQAVFVAAISPIISDSFTSATVATALPYPPAVYTGKAAFIAWLVGLPATTFAGFADHRLTNLQFDLIDSWCDPSRIKIGNYAPNRLLVQFPVGFNATSGQPILQKFLTEECSQEEMVFEKVNRPRSSNPAIAPFVWKIKSYVVDSYSFLNSNAVAQDFYGTVNIN
eukprot:Mycagemm_TRINITY_DN9734_c0_g1::TRINITY_DN9734_c0_g1_i1::g.4879::m.4879 type:complete len:238 gc:universal TRINITY_DN9734_c0_g1_i1:67-780(+)